MIPPYNRMTRQEIDAMIASERRAADFWSAKAGKGKALKAAQDSGKRTCRHCRSRYLPAEMATKARCVYCPGRKAKHA